MKHHRSDFALRAACLLVIASCSSNPPADRLNGPAPSGSGGARAGGSGGQAPSSGAGGTGTGGAAGAGGVVGSGGVSGTGGGTPVAGSSGADGGGEVAGPGPGADANPMSPDGAGGAGGAPAGQGQAGYVCPPGPFPAPLPAARTATLVRGGFQLAEGPVWIDAQKVLLFSDFSGTGSNGRIHRYDPAANRFDIFVSGVGTNGLAIDHTGQLVAASHDMQRLTRFDLTTGARTSVPGGSTHAGSPFNQVNDVVVRADGNIYFTDPDYQRGGRAGQDATAYYRLSPQGMVTRIGTGAQPNGIAISPDGAFLYVAGGFPLRRHALAADGSVMGGGMQLASSGSDGMAVDCAGNLYLTSGGGVGVFSPSGQSLGRIAGTSMGFITNAAFGGEDRRTLFITTSQALYQIRLEVPGFPN